MATNSSVLAYGTLLQIGNGVQGAGVVSDVQTVTFGGAPAAGSVTLLVAGKLWTFSTASGVPLTAAANTALNAVFAPTYVAPFVVTVAAQVITVTANPAGPFAFMPLGTIVVVSNTSLQTITVAHGTTGATKETFATVAGVEAMPFPKPTRATETYTTFDPGNLGYVRKIGKLKDSGTLTLTLIFQNDSTQDNITGLQALFESGVTYNYRIAVPTTIVSTTTTVFGYTDYISAILTQFGTDGTAADARLKITAQLTIDGPVQRFPPLV
jgi:hypothetical protein